MAILESNELTRTQNLRQFWDAGLGFIVSFMKISNDIL